MTVAHLAPPRPAPTLASAIVTVRARGLRVSTARRMILEALFAAEGPVSAETLEFVTCESAAPSRPWRPHGSTLRARSSRPSWATGRGSPTSRSSVCAPRARPQERWRDAPKHIIITTTERRIALPRAIDRSALVLVLVAGLVHVRMRVHEIAVAVLVLVLGVLVVVRGVGVRVRHIAVAVLMGVRMVVRVLVLRHPRSLSRLRATIPRRRASGRAARWAQPEQRELLVTDRESRRDVHARPQIP